MEFSRRILNVYRYTVYGFEISLSLPNFLSPSKKMNLDIEPERNPSDTALLRAFTENPFTQPLDSA